MDVLEHLWRGLRDAVAALQATGRLPDDLDLTPVTFDPQQEQGRGDFACNAALVLARQAGMPTRVLAPLLAETLESTAGIAGIDIAGPGFLNLTLAPALWAQVLDDLLRAGRRYGSADRGEGRLMTIAFRPADPSREKPASPARREATGAALANLLDHVGFRVDRDFRVRPDEADLTVRIGPVLNVKGRDADLFAGSSADDLDLAAIAGAVGGDAARLGMLLQPADMSLDLDLDRLADQSHANPVFHLHYAHARCCALRQRGEAIFNDAPGSSEWDVSAFKDEGARLILRLLALYPDQIDLAVRRCEPCRLAYHLQALADGLHRQYYRSLGVPYLRFIRDDDRLLTGARLALVRGVETVLKSGLDLLGSSAPNEMR